MLRGDGTGCRFAMLGHGARAPHDLTHFAVEGALGVARGFWGLVESNVDIDVEGLTEGQKSACIAALDRVQSAWGRTGVGDRLVLEWTPATDRRSAAPRE